MIRIERYSKSYGDNLILALPALELETAMYWLKGENGFGKTTFLKTIAGIIPFEGDIFLQDVSIKQHPICYRQLVNYAEAEPVFPGFLTGNDLIKFYKETKQAEQKQIEKLVEAFNIGAYNSKKIGTYSSGMTKKLALVLAFIGTAKVILLDEPFITLDQKAIQAFLSLTEAYHKTGTTFLMSSHQPFPSLELTPLLVADKTVLLQPAV